MHTGKFSLLARGRTYLASPRGPAILQAAKNGGHVRADATMGTINDEEASAVSRIELGNRIHAHTDTHKNTIPQNHTRTLTHSLLYAYTHKSPSTHTYLYSLHTGIASLLAQGRTYLVSPRGPEILQEAKIRGHVRACATTGTVSNEEARDICRMIFGNRPLIRKNTHTYVHTHTHTLVVIHTLIPKQTHKLASLTCTQASSPLCFKRPAIDESRKFLICREVINI